MQTGIILPPPGVKSPRRRRREEGRCEEDPSLTLTLSFSTHSFLTWLAGWLASPSSYPNYHHCCASQVVSMSQRVLLLFNHQALSSDKSLCPEARTLRRAREPRIPPRYPFKPGNKRLSLKSLSGSSLRNRRFTPTANRTPPGEPLHTPEVEGRAYDTEFLEAGRWAGGKKA